MTSFLGKWICKFRGHRRGKRISNIGGLVAYACPRCGAQHTRKVRVKP